MLHTPVLIVGGSLTGLSAAVFLSGHGVPCLVAERSPGGSAHPRFRGLTVRSMELFRSAGLAGRITAAGTPGPDIGGIARIRNLADPRARWEPVAWEDDVASLSQDDACSCDQDRLEPILREHAERHGADLRHATEVVGLEQDASGVRAVLRELPSGNEYPVRADYVVAADGAGGRTRGLLGIGRHGPGTLGHQVSVVFSADIEPVLDGRRFGACYVEDVGGALLPRDRGLWQLSVSYRPEEGQRPEDFTEERCLELIHTALGRREPSARVRLAAPWDLAAWVADRFQRGRVFLAGDAAHVMPPSGGFGGNTGIQDAHNLAWKLAETLSGAAGPGLPATYDAERRPVAESTLVQALARMPVSWLGEPGEEPPPLPPAVGHNTVSLGYRYRSAAVAAEPGDAPAGPEEGGPVTFAPLEDPRAGGGRPGSRAPHVVVERDGRRISTLDLFGSGLVLLAGTGAEAWGPAAREAAARLPGVRLAVWRVGPGGDLGDPGGAWAAAYGVGAGGAVLVRPDGFIAWRAPAPPEDPASALEDAVALGYSRRPSAPSAA